MVLHWLEIERIAASLRDQTVDHHHMRPKLKQAHSQIGPDESEPAGDQHALARVEGLVAAQARTRGGVADPDA